jgi:hypothetical protein
VLRLRCICSMIWSTLKLAARWRGGYSLNVGSNSNAAENGLDKEDTTSYPAHGLPFGMGMCPFLSWGTYTRTEPHTVRMRLCVWDLHALHPRLTNITPDEA